MHDPALKSYFADRDIIEILIRDHVPQWAGEIDFTTLREEPTELVSRKTLEKRRADMIWSADTTDGRRVVFLIEFQRKAEWRMALRTTTYASLTLERIRAGADFRPGDPLPELVCLVLYHGDGPWRGPDHVTELFERSDPGRFHLVSWKDEDTGRPADNLAALLLGLARNLPPEEMAEQAAALRQKVAELGNPRLEAVLGEKVRTMLELRDYTERTEAGRSKDDGRDGRQISAGVEGSGTAGGAGGSPGGSPGGSAGRSPGRSEDRPPAADRPQVRRGDGGAGVRGDRGALPGTDAIDRVTDALFECGTGEEFVERLRTA